MTFPLLFQEGCPFEPNENGIFWPDTQPGTSATGTCMPGYVSNDGPQRFCNQDGTWGDITNPCIDNPLGPLSDWLPFLAYGVVVIVSLITYYLAKKKNPDARNYVILGTGLSVVELVTDCLFLVQTSVLIRRFVRFVGGDIGLSCLIFTLNL